MTGLSFVSRGTRACACLLGLLAISACSSQNPGGQNVPSFDPQEIALVRVEPADGESAVPRNRPVTLTFSGPALPASITDQSVQVRTGGTLQTRPAGSFVVSGNLVEFNPTVIQGGGENALGFPGGQQIVVTIPLFNPQAGASTSSFLQKNNFVQNIEGNPITKSSGDNQITFTTGGGWIDPVSGPPGVVGVEFVPPANSLGQVPSDAAVVLVFDEPIDPSTLVLGKNLHLTNNSPTAPVSIFKRGIPSQTFLDLSMRKVIFKPVFGFGQGPFNIKINFIDPFNPASFSPTNLPTDLIGNRIQNFTFVATFDTQFDPIAKNTGLLIEDFTTPTNRDNSPGATTALWGDDQTLPFNLVGQPVTTRVVNVNIAAIMNISGGTTAINATLAVERRYCPTVNPLVSPGVPIPTGNPPTSAGRRQMNLFRVAELGPDGTVTRSGWGPDSDALFASTYSTCIVRLGHKRLNTDLVAGSLFSNFDVDNFVTVANFPNYRVPQAKDINGGALNDGYFDWPKFDTFFNYSGMNDLIIDVEATEGTNWQQFRTFLAVDAAFGNCSCTNFFGCAPNSSIGRRQVDATFGGDIDDPANGSLFGSVFNPGPWVNVMQFELKRLVSQGTSKFRDTGSPNPTYLPAIVSPTVQPGGASAEIFFSGSDDGVVDLTGWQSNITALNGRRWIRFRVILSSNLFTGARARIGRVELPFTFP